MTIKNSKSFWDKVDKRGPDECWLWKASVSGNTRNRKGYGQFWMEDNAGKRARITANRLSWLLTNGPIPADRWVLHKCPTGSNSLCCNPAHLYLGTAKENSADMVREGRHFVKNNPSVSRGECNGNAKLSANDVRRIRQLYAAGKYKIPALATRFDRGRATIQYIVSGRTWKNI